MTLDLIIQHNIQITPILNKNGVSYWGAGKMVYNPSTNRSYVPNHLYAQGLTIDKAVDNLIAGNTLYVLDEDGNLNENKEQINLDNS